VKEYEGRAPKYFGLEQALFLVRKILRCRQRSASRVSGQVARVADGASEQRRQVRVVAHVPLLRVALSHRRHVVSIRRPGLFADRDLGPLTRVVQTEHL